MRKIELNSGVVFASIGIALLAVVASGNQDKDKRPIDEAVDMLRGWGLEAEERPDDPRAEALELAFSKVASGHGERVAADEYFARAIGRYQLESTPDGGLFRIDTATGYTWELKRWEDPSTTDGLNGDWEILAGPTGGLTPRPYPGDPYDEAAHLVDSVTDLFMRDFYEDLKKK